MIDIIELNANKSWYFSFHRDSVIITLLILFWIISALKLRELHQSRHYFPQVMQLASDILSKIPNNIDYERTEKLIGSHKTPLDVVLLQEIGRYNVLLAQTRDSLEELQRGIKGSVLMSQELEEIFACIYDGRVPSLWLTAYPSLKLLGAWTRDLINRVEHFANWAQTTHPPLLFWLAAYTFPTGFLTAVLQTSARLWNVSIDSLSWEFTVFSTDESAIIEQPGVTTSD